MLDFLKRTKCKPAPDELTRIAKYLSQEYLFDKEERAKEISKIYRMISKRLDPVNPPYTTTLMGTGGIEKITLVVEDKKFKMLIESINKLEPHHIEELTLNQLGYLKKALDEVHLDLWNDKVNE